VRRLHFGDLPAGLGAEFVVEGDEAHHMIRVLRARVGDVFRVFDGVGREVEAEVVAVERRTATLRVVRETEPRRPARDVVLCCAIPRGQRMEWMVEKCTEAGVGRIVPLRTAREVRETASDNQRRRWAPSALEAAKQSGRACVPEIEEPCALGAALASVAGHRLLFADPAVGRALRSFLERAVAEEDPLAIFIGPEGGFDDAERASLTDAGADPFGLGALILRVETAALIAVHAAATRAGPPRSGTPT